MRRALLHDLRLSKCFESGGCRQVKYGDEVDDGRPRKTTTDTAMSNWKELLAALC